MKVKNIIKILLFLILLFVYLIGGLLQFVVGISYYFIAVTLLVLFLCYSLATIEPNSSKSKLLYLTFYVFFVIICALSSLLNTSNFIKTVLYLVFFISPFLIVNILNKIKPKKDILQRLFLLLPIIQVGVLLVQRLFGNQLIQFNNASQQIRLEDFYFGTFLIKNDHALGFTMIAILLFFSDKMRLNLVKLALLNFSVLLSIFLTNSKISIALILPVTLYIWYYKFNSKSRAFMFITASVLGIVFFISFQKELIQKLKPALETIEKPRALAAYEDGFATRGQTLVKFFNDDLEFLGNGPYSYFNILSGSFSKAPNFSQWIWAYHDLGMLGLILSLILVLTIKGYLFKTKKFNLLSFILLFYGFFTTILFDLTFILTYILILYLDGKSSNNTLSRLEENKQ